MKELAGIVVKTQSVERISQAIGQQAERVSQAERHAALSGKLASVEAAPTLYIAIDGTGVPVVARETEGRKGKQTERARTREAKLGCVFTQTLLDDQGRLRRDVHSTTYVGAIETAEQFGPRIYAEAVRRGLKRAPQIIVVGDGAPWIWNIADEHFHDAIQIIDLYHARQHLTELANSVYGQATTKATDWAAGRSQQLDEGNIEAVLTALRRLRPRDGAAQKAVHSACTTFKAMPIGCAMPTSAVNRSSSVRVSSKPAAKPSSANASSNPACNGPFEVPMTSSLCAACNSAADGKSSGKIERRVRPALPTNMSRIREATKAGDFRYRRYNGEQFARVDRRTPWQET